MPHSQLSNSDDITLILAKIDDSFNLCARKNCPSFVGFLSEPESVAVKAYLNTQGFYSKFGRDAKYGFFGGYDNAERLIFAALPDWAASSDEIDFPITVVRFSHRPEYELQHKDYLGSMMALGIARNRVGDIIVKPDGAAVFLHNSIANHVIGQIEKIGRVGVKVEVADNEQFEFAPEYKNIRATIASNRLDCIVASLINSSRERAVELLSAKLVFINGIESMNTSKRINEGDVLTIRKKGKFIIDSVGEKTKKGRTVLIARHKI